VNSGIHSINPYKCTQFLNNIELKADQTHNSEVEKNRRTQTIRGLMAESRFDIKRHKKI
jgi:hypothetical protein